jgi:transposase-like protein
MAAKKNTKGKRYSDADKAKIIALVDKVNAEKGRGGAAAAAKKYKVSPISISNWIKASGSAPAPRKGAGKRPAKSAGTWEKMLALKADIDIMEKKLAAKKAEFSKLAKKL